MSDSSTVRRTYQYRLYRCDKKDRRLQRKVRMAASIWNHFVALQRRYYRLTGGYRSLTRMNNHVLKLRKTRRFARWRDLHSQVCQNVCLRVDDAYQRFFKQLVKRPPKFKPARQYKSFTFPQSGYQLLDYNRNQLKANGHYTRARGTIRIAGTSYRFVQHRPRHGQIKTLTVKRDAAGHWWLFFSVIEPLQPEEASTGDSGGFDFGLKTFLTDDAGRAYGNPLFYTLGLRQTRQLHRQLSRKQRGSKRRKRAKLALARQSERVANRRRDFHFKRAHRLCDEYDTLYFEDLNLVGMKALWGRKVSDLGFGDFMDILAWVARKRGRQVVQIGRFERTTQTCSGCGRRHTLALRDRVLACVCGLTLDRDHNAAINIQSIGASMDYRSEHKTRVRLRSRVEGRSPTF